MSFLHSLIQLAAKLPVDLSQSKYNHSSKGKLIALARVPQALPSATALDLGCGDGWWSDQLKHLGFAVTAVDQEREYPNKDSAQRYKDMIAMNLNEPLPLPDASFNLVWCSEVIGFLKNYQQTIKEIRRVLEPGGTFIFTTPNSFSWLHYFFKMFGLSNQDWHHEKHINFLRLNDIKQLFPEAQVFGYFPYLIIKATIQSGVGLLSPTFVIIGKKQ
ncbi:MAG: hypothetical protein A3H70_03825 [Candidatus Komeilibacteria bacterium RIFCSPLOWO2_02_FULL_48_11]|uniref:Methyltransferase type 11 domain-containing protein n=1 Tax=Candidatus Komeilibacteria bacterium RIFCSPLOWO2_02_FULL_48_11 TaxID=1798553 RepID=A0A1G2BNY6_9BACT|nr:MAG: hypothetical protein A3H70_03825 [Candidatus Komeilibacteria bacterium RIFCSPLOWO2_02_FULL_48_11]